MGLRAFLYVRKQVEAPCFLQTPTSRTKHSLVARLPSREPRDNERPHRAWFLSRRFQKQNLSSWWTERQKEQPVVMRVQGGCVVFSTPKRNTFLDFSMNFDLNLAGRWTHFCLPYLPYFIHQSKLDGWCKLDHYFVGHS